MRRALLQAFAAQLRNDDVVVIEATDNAAAVAEVIGPHVKRVVIANPKQVRLIAHAKIKMDKIDAAVLAQLYASGFLPEVWIADPRTQALRRQVTRRNQIVRQRSRLKNVIQSILHAHLIPPCPAAKCSIAKAAPGSKRSPAGGRTSGNRTPRAGDRPPRRGFAGHRARSCPACTGL
jgi:transposase